MKRSLTGHGTFIRRHFRTSTMVVDPHPPLNIYDNRNPDYSDGGLPLTEIWVGDLGNVNSHIAEGMKKKDNKSQVHK